MNFGRCEPVMCWRVVHISSLLEKKREVKCTVSYLIFYLLIQKAQNTHEGLGSNCKCVFLQYIDIHLGAKSKCRYRLTGCFFGVHLHKPDCRQRQSHLMYAIVTVVMEMKVS